MLLIALLAEIFILFILSPHVISTMFTFLMLLFPSRSIAVTVITLVLFPGTIIHELSHLFTAEILGVKAGKLELVPDNIRKAEVQTGSVAIAVTDPLRRTLIGLAPFVTGLLLITAISWFLSASIGEAVNAFQSGTLYTHPSLYMAIGGVYLVFAISNTMIPSRVDLKGTPVVLGVIIAITITAYFVGFRFALTGSSLELAQTILQALVQSLALVVAINTALLVVISLNIRLMTKVLGIRLVSVNPH